MIKDKEQLFHKFYEMTLAGLEAIEKDEIEELVELINQRELIKDQIDQLDKKNGSIIMNTELKNLVSHIQQLDAKMISSMLNKKTEIQSKMNSIQTGKQLRNQYSQHYENFDGLFYDKKS